MSRTPVVTHVHGETSLRDISKKSNQEKATKQQVEKGKKCGHDSSDNSTHEECEEEREGQEARFKRGVKALSPAAKGPIELLIRLEKDGVVVTRTVTK